MHGNRECGAYRSAREVTAPRQPADRRSHLTTHMLMINTWVERPEGTVCRLQGRVPRLGGTTHMCETTRNSWRAACSTGSHWP